MKFKARDKVVFEADYIPNNHVMTVKRGTHKRHGFDMVHLRLEGGEGIAYASQLRPATAEEEATGFRAKEPAMSEFKVGDKVVAINYELHGGIRVLKEIIDGKYLVFKHDGFHKNLFRQATPEEITAGHRIDTKQIEEVGDDFPIENHISPNCKAKDV